MTPRQARTERRAAERKAKKLEMKRNKAAGAAPSAPESLYPSSDRKGALTNGTFASQTPAPAAPPLPTGFVSQTPSTRTEINRANAQHSTGPVTIQGKLASSRNSLKHGLASGQLIVAGEDPAAFESLLGALLEEHQPASPTEELLIHEMAQSYWLTQRAIRLQNECFNAEGVDEKRLSLYMRYQTTHNRAFHKALSTLMKIKKEHARGFVSQSAKRAPANPGFVRQNRIETPSTSQFVRQNADREDQNQAPLVKAEAA